MPDLTTTVETIINHKPNKSTVLELKKDHKNASITLSRILKQRGVSDAYWALRCWPYKTTAKLRAQVAQSVLSIFEDRYPYDGRVRHCIEAMHLYSAGDITQKEFDVVVKATKKAARITLPLDPKDLQIQVTYAIGAATGTTVYDAAISAAKAKGHATNARNIYTDNEAFKTYLNAVGLQWSLQRALLINFIKD